LAVGPRHSRGPVQFRPGLSGLCCCVEIRDAAAWKCGCYNPMPIGTFDRAGALVFVEFL
jgi:hypothetical protein